jgi:hypothetical protein
VPSLELFARYGAALFNPCFIRGVLKDICKEMNKEIRFGQFIEKGGHCLERSFKLRSFNQKLLIGITQQ